MPTRSLQPVLKWASLLTGVVALWLSYSRVGAPYITNDGYQYLDAASNLESGRCFCTNVALFDEQIGFGRLPVPFTHFAPGYPLLMAAISHLGSSAENAGYIISASGFLAVLWLIWDIGLGLHGKPWIVAAFSLLWITHATALLYASAVGTESLFAALLMGLAALIARDVRSQGKNPVLLVMIGAVAGLSYGIRYPGVFLVCGAGLYLLVRIWRTPQARLEASAGLVSAIVLVGAVQIRNVIYTGSWRGGFQNRGYQTLPAILAGTIRSWTHLVVGDRVPLRFDLWTLIFTLSASVVLFVSVRSCIQNRNGTPAAAPRALRWLLFIGFTYIAGVMLAALTTIARDFSRYYFPVYPVFLVCAAAAVSPLARGWKALAVAVTVISLIAVEARSLAVAPPKPDWVLTKNVLAADVYPGVPLLDWLRERVGSNDVVVAVQGQAIHYLLQRPVVAVISPEFSRQKKDEAGYRALMERYRSRYLIVLSDASSATASEQISTPFLSYLASGHVPTWLKLAASTSRAAVYECANCAR